MSFDVQSLDIPSLLNLAAQSASLVGRSLFLRTEDNFPLDRPRRGRERDLMVMMMMTMIMMTMIMVIMMMAIVIVMMTMMAI